jgi:hypothetical protein
VPLFGFSFLLFVECLHRLSGNQRRTQNAMQLQKSKKKLYTAAKMLSLPKHIGNVTVKKAQRVAALRTAISLQKPVVETSVSKTATTTKDAAPNEPEIDADERRRQQQKEASKRYREQKKEKFKKEAKNLSAHAKRNKKYRDGRAGDETAAAMKQSVKAVTKAATAMKK